MVWWRKLFLVAVAAALVASVTNPSRADTIVVPESEAVPATIGIELHDLSNQVGGYLDNAERVHLRLVQLRKALDDCQSCAEQGAMQGEYDRLDQQQRQRRQAEGMAMHAIGLPYNNFAEAATAIFGPDYRSPDPAATARFARAKWNAELNYCYFSSGGDIQKTFACRAVYSQPKAQAAAQDVPRECLDQIGRAANIDLGHIPPPAPSAAFGAYKAAWARYDTCRRNGDIYQWIQHEAVHTCRVDKIEATVELAAFACACDGIPRPPSMACPVPVTQPAVALPQLVVEHPVGHVLLTDPGPDLMGIRLLMPMAEAERIVATHMPIGRTGIIGQAAHNPAMVPQQLEYQTGGFGGKIFLSRDGNEYIALLEATRTAPGRVFQAARAIWLPVGGDGKLVDEERRARGEPTSPRGMNAMFWGKTASLLCGGRSPEDTRFWVDQSSGWPLGQSPGDPSDLRVSILHSLGMPRLGPLVPLAGVEDCGPLLQLSSGGNPGDPARTGRPMFVVERLFDIGLTNWFTSKGEDSLAP